MTLFFPELLYEYILLCHFSVANIFVGDDVIDNCTVA
jgi:hypothetical protein